MRLDNCTECGKALSTDKRRKGNICRSCLMKMPETPEQREKRAAKIRMAWRSRPELIEAQRERCRAAMTPERRAAAAEVMRRNRNWEKTPRDAMRKWQSAGVRAAIERRMGWCPVELRDDYRALRTKGISAVEARSMILDLHEKNMAAFRRKLGAA